MKKIILFILLFNCFQNSFSQINFFKTFPFGDLANYNWSTVGYAIETTDGGYMMFSNVYVGTDVDIFMIKLDENAEVQWTKRNENANINDLLVSGLQNSDGEYVIASTYDLNSTIYEEEVNYWRMDSLGNVIIYRYLTMSGICCWDLTTANVIQTNDGNYVFSHLNFGISTSNGLMKKVNSIGNNVWGGNFGSYSRINKVLETNSGELLFVGSAISGIKYAKIEEWSANGTFLDLVNLFHPLSQTGSTNSPTSMLEMNDGYLIPINFTNDGTNYHLWLTKLNFNLDTVWTKTFMGYSSIMGIDTLASGNVVMVGTKMNAYTDLDLQLIVLDNNHDILFTREIGTTERDYPNVFSKMSDGSFMISGVSGDNGVYQKDLFLLKLDTNLCVKPQASFIQDTNAVFLAGESGLAFIDRTNYFVTDSSNYSWYWDFGDGDTSTLEHPSHIYSAQGNYLVTFIADNGCSRDTVQMQFNAVCEGEEDHFIASDTLLDVQFNDNSAVASFWNWDFGDAGFSTDENPFHQYASSGTYQVCLSYDNTCGNLTICDSVTVFCDFPIVELGADQNLCIGNTVQLDAFNSGTTYQWSTGETNSEINVTTSGLYWVQATNVCGSMSVDSVQLNFYSVPLLDIGNDSVICQGDGILFFNHNGNNYYDFEWYSNNVLVDSDSIYNATFGTYGNYEIQVIASNNGCYDSTLIYVNVLTPLNCNPSLAYCIPTSSTGTAQGDYINRVGLNGFDNNNSGSTGGPSYRNYFPTHQATLLPGTNYGLIRQYSFTNTLRCGVWIDYNQDGVFDNTNERIFAGGAGAGTSTSYFTTPTDIPCGVTRMRVRLMDAVNNASVDPCSPSVYGETEDYKIVFTCVCPSISLTANIDHESCIENDGSITISQNGGVNPVEYQWSNSQTGSYITQLSGGNYSVTMTDFNGCVSSGNFTVQDAFIPFDLSSTVVEPNCFGDCDGEATVVISGNSGSYSVLWDVSTGSQTAMTADALCAGTYEVFVTDGDGCEDSLNVILPEPNEILISVDTTFELNQQCNATIILSPSGGTGTYTYVWSDGLDPLSSQDSLCAGVYSVTVTDQNGCSSSENITITNINGIGIGEISNSGDLIVYPNPIHSVLYLDSRLEKAAIATITITDVTGKIIFIETDFTAKGDLKAIDMSGFVNGIYFLSVKMNSESNYIYKLMKQ
jgi:PKD repeat protein